MTSTVLGIDGGATRTRAVLVSTNGQFIGYGLGGPSNYDAVGVKVTRQNVAKAISRSLNMAGTPKPEIKAVFMGMAGVVSQSDRDVIMEIASSIPTLRGAIIQVDHDLRIALAGGLTGKPGIVLIVGTGCSCFGLNQAGQTLRVGGWGHILDDFGSSYYLGLHALYATVRSSDGRIPPTLLSSKILERLTISDVQNIMWRVYHKGLQPAEIAALAPIVIKAAEQGDAAAIKIIDKGVEELSILVQTAANRLGFIRDGSVQQTDLHVVMTGGLVDSSQYYRHALLKIIQEKLPGVKTPPAFLPPVFGAALLALNAAGVIQTPTLTDSLKKSATLYSSASDS